MFFRKNNIYIFGFAGADIVRDRLSFGGFVGFSYPAN
jgi:hypothetical protein